MGDEIKPYEIAVPEADLADLKVRLARSRFPDELEAAEWDLGAPLADIRRLAKHWQTTFDWRAAEARLNRFPQFTTDVAAEGFEPVNLHFIHRRSEDPDAVPLLFIHGWPGSVYEGSKLIDALTQAQDQGGADDGPKFHVVAPSLPNYGFSSGVGRQGFSIDQYAEVLNKLMLRLGYDRYATQGGDWGWFISRALSHHYPQHVKATHLNLDVARPPGWLRHPVLALEHGVKPYSKHERDGFARSAWFLKEGSGYGAVHSTKPQTIGYGLSDSPVALLSWIYEKLHDWTDDYAWTDDEILTWISIYWFSTAGPAASVRIYYEFARVNRGEATRPGQMTQEQMMDWQPVVVGYSHFPKDVIVRPSVWTRTGGRVVFERTHPSGGHFPAWERPEDIAGDLREMFGRNGTAAVAVRGAGSKL
ncbi:alpha/beta-hydrolase [Apiospora marii]|uniref:Alpha/beta-hydrolase n=1 Tax=Apiospora marii TaxID=335849 RepID=A0ABR1R496_9PEZI